MYIKRNKSRNGDCPSNLIWLNAGVVDVINTAGSLKNLEGAKKAAFVQKMHDITTYE